jgi:hypothetical protein
VTTDTTGRAAATGFTPTSAGSLQGVSASFQGGTAVATTTLAVVGAAGAGGAVAATTLTGGSTTPTEGEFGETVSGVPGTATENRSDGSSCARPFQQMVFLVIVISGQQVTVRSMVLTREYASGATRSGIVAVPITLIKD